MTVIDYILIVGIVIIFIFLILELLGRKRAYVGTIVITKENNRILFSLELDGSPEELQFKKEAYFRVRRIPEEESNRG